MSHATLSCQRVIDACLEALEATHSALDLTGDDLDALDGLRCDVRVMEGLLALAMAAQREGTPSMQVSAGDFLLLADFWVAEARVTPAAAT